MKTNDNLNEDDVHEILVAKSDWYEVFELKYNNSTSGKRTGDTSPIGGLYRSNRCIMNLQVPINIINNNQHDTDMSFSDKDVPKTTDMDFFISDNNYKDLICEVLWELSPQQSLKILELLAPVWRSSYERSSGNENPLNWYSMLGILIYNIQADKNIAESFTEKYAGKLIAENDWSIYSEEEKISIFEWYNKSEYSQHRRIVCFPFSKLGFPTMYDLFKIRS